jgi:SP family myo-inositol transporter-like MFS transporter 13
MPSAEIPRSQCYFYLLSLLACTGGFLFGYDTGVISGAIILIKNEYTITDAMQVSRNDWQKETEQTPFQELIVSVTVGAAAVFALFGAFLNDRFGRKKVILTSSLIFTVGAIEMAMADKVFVGQFVDQLLVGRLIVGIGLGLSSMTVDPYRADQSNKRLL